MTSIWKSIILITTFVTLVTVNGLPKRTSPSRTATKDDLDENIRNPLIETFYPRGIRVSIRHMDGMEIFAFHGKINSQIDRYESGNLSKDITKPTDGRWVFESDSMLRVGDVINFWIFVQRNGMGNRVDNLTYVVRELKSQSLMREPPSRNTNNNVRPSTNHNHPLEASVFTTDRDYLHMESPHQHSHTSPSSSSSSADTITTTQPNKDDCTNPCNDEQFSKIITQLNATLIQVSSLHDKIVPLQNQVESLTELLQELIRDQHIGTKLLLLGDQPPRTNPVETIRQLITEKLELLDLDDKIHQAYYSDNGIMFEMSTSIDKKRILFRAMTRLKNSNYMIVDPEIELQQKEKDDDDEKKRVQSGRDFVQGGRPRHDYVDQVDMRDGMQNDQAGLQSGEGEDEVIAHHGRDKEDVGHVKAPLDVIYQSASDTPGTFLVSTKKSRTGSDRQTTERPRVGQSNYEESTDRQDSRPSVDPFKPSTTTNGAQSGSRGQQGSSGRDSQQEFSQAGSWDSQQGPGSGSRGQTQPSTGSRDSQQRTTTGSRGRTQPTSGSWDSQQGTGSSSGSRDQIQHSSGSWDSQQGTGSESLGQAQSSTGSRDSQQSTFGGTRGQTQPSTGSRDFQQETSLAGSLDSERSTSTGTRGQDQPSTTSRKSPSRAQEQTPSTSDGRDSEKRTSSSGSRDSQQRTTSGSRGQGQSNPGNWDSQQGSGSESQGQDQSSTGSRDFQQSTFSGSQGQTKHSTGSRDSQQATSSGSRGSHQTDGASGSESYSTKKEGQDFNRGEDGYSITKKEKTRPSSKKVARPASSHQNDDDQIRTSTRRTSSDGGSRHISQTNVRTQDRPTGRPTNIGQQSEVQSGFDQYQTPSRSRSDSTNQPGFNLGTPGRSIYNSGTGPVYGSY